MNIKTVRKGNWSDPLTWETSSVPTSLDKVIINHPVYIDKSVSCAGAEVNELLEFTGTLDTTLTSTANITVDKEGIIVMVQPNSKINYTIRFTGINENNFIGSGMDVLPSDVGLWVMGIGEIYFSGAEKTSWTRAKSEIKAGDKTFQVNGVVGWNVGDELIITPTTKGVIASDEVKIVSINGDTITVDKALTAHPLVTTQSGYSYTAEVANLTRNIKIEGTSIGQSHIFISSKSPQTVINTAIRFMGPRKNQGGTTDKEFVIGRYGLHFHHCGDISGTKLVGNVIRDTGSHCFVPHGSHGLLIKENIAYNVTETPYWYDLNHKTHRTIWDRNLAATVKYVPRSLNMDLKETDPEVTVTFAASGFLIGMGDDNIFRFNVAVGVMGDPRTGGGFNWEANNEGIPLFHDNLAHNCNSGARIWQNTENNHVITSFVAYNCEIGVYHGAYANSYTYDKCDIIGCPFIFHGASVNSSRVRLLRSNLDTIIAEASPLPGRLPILVRDCKYNTLIDMVGQLDEPGSHSIDVVNCTGVNKVDPNANSFEVIRVQPRTGQCTRITRSGTTNISQFAPTLWGIGTGLKAEYFNDATFTNKVFERIDSFVMFPEWDNVVHHLITSKILSVRWTGFIEPQFSESYIFNLASAGTAKLWIDNKQITGPIALVAGKKYPIKLEFVNNDTNLRGGMNFLWKCPSLDKFNPVQEGEYVPQSQLYPADITVPPVNNPPVANAGLDKTITLPTNVARLSGSGIDSDGQIVKYQWTYPGGVTVLSPNSAETDVLFNSAGSYVFTLTVTDDKGATGSDTVTITVNPVSVNKPPVVSASATMTDYSDFILRGVASDSDGVITAYQWTQTAGPSVTINNANTSVATVTRAIRGVGIIYEFTLTVTDDKGAKALTKVTIV